MKTTSSNTPRNNQSPMDWAPKRVIHKTTELTDFTQLYFRDTLYIDDANSACMAIVISEDGGVDLVFSTRAADL